jgi:protein PhnA
MKIAEERFPALAEKSGREAYKTTLSQTGAVVVKTSQGQMVERRSDGTSTVIKHLSVGKRVKSGAILKRVK